MRALILIGLSLAVTPAVARDVDLDSWVERDLIPYAREQLTTLPRFRDESFRFVIMSDDSPRSEGTALALHLRDRLRDAVSELSTVRVAWQADQPGVGLVANASQLDCTRSDADYFVGIELTELREGRIQVRVRALDIEERAWVSDFDREWQGVVNGAEHRLLRRYAADPTFRGERDAPWQDTETDLLAAQLAFEIGCQLLRQTDGEYVVATATNDGQVDATTALVELVTNNLAGIRALQFGEGAVANATIGGKAHRIDDDLFQYWVTITPTDPDTAMTTLSADAYVRIPDEYRAATLVPEATYSFAEGSGELLTQFRVTRLPRQSACAAGERYRPGSSTAGGGFSVSTGDCYALEVGAADDVVTFFLNHQRNFGLVRLSDQRCAEQSLARIVKAGEDTRLPLPLEMIQTGA